MIRFHVVKSSAVALALAGIISLGAAVYGVAGTSSAGLYFGKSKRELPIYAVQTEQKKVALTFDAAWGADKTEDLLATLNQYGIKATFFLVGFWVEAHPDMVAKIDQAGMEIGTHSNTHPHMAKLSSSQVRLELSQSKKMIEDITQKRVDLFRAPFGEYNNTVLAAAREEELFTIQWDVDTLDWKNLGAQEMAERVQQKATAGSIVLMHNDGKNTPSALPLIIQALQLKGYEFCTVGELIYRDGFTINHEGRQIKNS